MLMCAQTNHPGLTVDQYRDLYLACVEMRTKSLRNLVIMRKNNLSLPIRTMAAKRLWVWTHRRNRISIRLQYLLATEN